MEDDISRQRNLSAGPAAVPAEPLWRLAPTRDCDGRGMADFMMLVPGLAKRPRVCRERVAALVREVCESYGERVAFADINYAISVVWVTVAAEPGLGAQVARSIREKVPDAVMVGGYLGASSDLQVAGLQRPAWWRRLRRLSQGVGRLLGGPGG